MNRICLVLRDLLVTLKELIRKSSLDKDLKRERLSLSDFLAKVLATRNFSWKNS
jgi:phage FluMu protein gp41